MLTRPALLQPGDRIRIVAPSGPVVERDRFDAGIAWLRRIGLEPVYDENVFTRTGYLAGSDQRRYDEMAAALNDPDAAAIWFARGGYGATRLLSEFDTGMVNKKPRWLIGFSDATAFHSLWQRAGVQSLHAVNITGLVRWSETAQQRLRDYLFNSTMPPLTGTAVTGNGSVSGVLAGGNLTLLASMVGTGYLPSLRDTIVFIEDVAERPYRLDRYLTQLQQSGAFAGVRGFVIGQLTNCDDPPEQNHHCSALEVVCEILKPLEVPVLANIAVGHERSSMPLPLGAEAHLDIDRGELSFDSAKI